jgi:hypothetical protein
LQRIVPRKKEEGEATENSAKKNKWLIGTNQTKWSTALTVPVSNKN